MLILIKVGTTAEAELSTYRVLMIFDYPLCFDVPSLRRPSYRGSFLAYIARRLGELGIVQINSVAFCETSETFNPPP